MSLPAEIQQAQILDWWEASHEHICNALKDRLPALYYHVDEKIDAMSLKDLARKGRVRSEQIEPIVSGWMQKTYAELTHDLDKSMRLSLAALEGNEAADQWSYSEMAIAGSALAISAAPVAAVPFFAGGLTAAGTVVLGFTIGGGALLALPVAALAGGAVLAALGPSARAKAMASLKQRYRSAIHAAIASRVMGDKDNPQQPSLKGTLLGELQCVALKRMDEAK
ncbi:hypothetical protein [Paracoccus sp. DMF]|uniref:hypothetical protein n=1 Tax=Paracoccus sp. DMF TaxID=400837 RepID=UPI0011026437|nr:hypothetical protein [Paracoccus sp. DMF]MCV2445998.1 hypothetical protein [Paracoccus sp. DMF]